MYWIPAFAGMTAGGDFSKFSSVFPVRSVVQDFLPLI
jgi:hypothetical protein